MGLDMVVHVYDHSTWDAVEGELGNLGHPQLLSNLKAIPKPYLQEILSQNKEKNRETKPNEKRKKPSRSGCQLTFF